MQAVAAIDAPTPHRFVKITLRLFAGISTGSVSSNPALSASACTASRSRTPQRGSRSRNCASKASLLGAVIRAVASIRSVQVQYVSRGQSLARAAHERHGRFPRRDVDHVDAHDRRDFANAPVAAQHIEQERRVQVGELFMRAPRCDRSARIGVRIAWLPHDARQRGRTMHGMLSGAARDLQHHAGSRQNAREDR